MLFYVDGHSDKSTCNGSKKGHLSLKQKSFNQKVCKFFIIYSTLSRI